MQSSSPKSEKESTKDTNTTRIYASLLILFLLLFIFLPGMILILTIGMLPTLGARLSDPTPLKSQTYCVGFCNFAGLIPSLYDLSQSRFALKEAYQMIHNEFNLLIILVFSAIGWMIFFIIPAITLSIYRSRDKANLIKMVKRYDNLREIWGEAIPVSEIMSAVQSQGKK